MVLCIEPQKIYSPGGATKLLFLIVENRLMFDMQIILVMTSHCITTSPKKLQDLAISFIEIVKPCMCVRSTCNKYNYMSTDSSQLSIRVII